MSESSNREAALFDAAAQLPTDQRSEYLRQACAGEDDLRRRVEALLEAHEQAGDFLEQPAAPARPTIVMAFPVTEKSGDRIGRYKLLQQIGEGGCGVVYMAEQEQPVRRRVALKVIKLGMDTKSVIARFESERQALAMMDHPNIARVLDAGATEIGRPYFVMELVRGIKITDYCDQNKLSTIERLNLFTQVCHAIQHAHQKGIIHRDIKPSNILVTVHDGVPVPKVIDFGIAKATQGRLTDQTLFTAFEQFIGTPAYMSPEQAEMSGLDVDTRSDIYALGVLLYELLTGRTPFDPKELLSSGLDELRRTIREKEPARPSTRLSTMLQADLTAVAQRRQSEAPKLIHALRGDLDWIVMKTLEKDRTRRYETANGLAVDIQRYLGNEPVTARPPSTLYRFQKLVRRNRTTVATVGAGIAALIIGLVFSLYLYVQEKTAFKRAVAAEQAEKELRESAEQGAAWGQQIARAGLLLMRGQYDGSEQLLLGVPPHASTVPFYNVFGGVHARRGEWPAALTNWNLVIQYAPADPMGYFYLAPLYLQLNDLGGYERTRTQLLQQFGNTTDPRTAERMVKTSLILPASMDEMAVITRMAGVAVQDPTIENWGFNLFAKGLAEYRLGHFAAAADLLEKIPPLDTSPYCRAEAALVLAMAQSQLGQISPSRAALAQATEIINHEFPREGHLEDEWNDWIIAHVLLHEALALMPGSPAPAAERSPADWQADLTKAGYKFTSELQDDGTWELELDRQPITNLTLLRGIPISRLSLMHTPVSDLTPLRALPLEKLKLSGTQITDLSPLAGLPLEVLQISGTAVADIGPLHGMPLRDLKMTDCEAITNLQALAGMTTLESLILPPHAKNFEFLRHFPRLERLGFQYDSGVAGPAQTSAEFWQEFDRHAGRISAPAPP